MSAVSILNAHKDLSARRNDALVRLESVKKAFEKEPYLSDDKIMTFCAGSLSRLEMGGNSDLDVFVINDGGEVSPLRSARVLSRVADLNESLGFPPFSDELRYMKIYSGSRIIEDTGKPRDDSENSFTTRMLLLLESKPLSNSNLYELIVRKVCENYFRDNKGKSDFRPLFLINDLLRYWRTLCLNYEQCRDDPKKPWRKKNVNLKFSRMTTVFSTIAVLMVDRAKGVEDFIPRVGMTPLERLAYAIDELNNNALNDDFSEFLDHYSTFLRIKDSRKPERVLQKGGTKEKMRGSAEFVSGFFRRVFEDSSIREYARFLMI